MPTRTYQIPMDGLFSNQTNYGNMDLESQRIKEEEQLRADLAREQLLGIATTPMSLSNINRFAPAEMVQSEYPIPDAEPYSTLTARQAPSSIVGGMFSPEISRAAEMDYMLKRQAAMQNEAMAFAQLTPMQQAQFGFYRGGQQLGDALGGALGGKDPQLQMISLQQQILSELDPSDPEQHLMIAQKYARVAPELAIKIADNARGELVKIKQAKGASKLNVTAKVQEAEAYASKFGIEGSVEYNNAYKTYLQGAEKLSEKERIGARVSELTRMLNIGDGGIPFSLNERKAIEAELATYEKAQKSNIIDVGLAKDTRQVVYYDKDSGRQYVIEKNPTNPKEQIAVPYSGGIDKTTSTVTATSESKGADEGARTIAELSAKRVDSAKVSAAKAIEQAGLLQELLKTPQPISGSGAAVRVGALRVFSTFGLTSSKDDEALGNADKFNALAGERVISFIKALGSNPTDTDREFARTIGPALEKGTKTNADLINFLLERARKVVKDADAMENYFYDNKYSLRGYKSPFLIDLEAPKSNISNKPVNQMTRQELEDAIEAKKRESK